MGDPVLIAPYFEQWISVPVRGKCKQCLKDYDTERPKGVVEVAKKKGRGDWPWPGYCPKCRWTANSSQDAAAQRFKPELRKPKTTVAPSGKPQQVMAGL